MGRLSIVSHLLKNSSVTTARIFSGRFRATGEEAETQGK